MIRDTSNMTALLAMEGSYPCGEGDVSTWCHELTTSLRDVDFTLLAITAHPYEPLPATLPANVRRVITVPIWGTEDPAEYGNHASFSEYLRRRWATTAPTVEQDYLPHFERFLREVMRPTQPRRAVGVTLLEMHLHLRYYDYRQTHAHPAVWEAFAAVAQQAWRETYPAAPPPRLGEVRDAWRLFYRLMLPLAVDVPRYGIAHSAAAGFCGLPCVVGKLRWRTPYLLTEHGPYLREQYLRVPRDVTSPFVRWFLSRLVGTVVDVNYEFADRVAPVCEHTAEWERRRGAAPSRIHVIRNGVNPLRFTPAPRDDHRGPTVINLAEFMPLNGQIDLIEAAALVRRSVPGVQFRLYGSPVDGEYYQQCSDLLRALDLKDTVILAPPPEDRASLLQQADIVACPYVSTGLPRILIEAMLMEAAVVATDVGGVRETLGDAGMVVRAGEPADMADALTTLLNLPDSRRRLGQHARERALRYFSAEQFADEYRMAYHDLAEPLAAAIRPAPLRVRDAATRLRRSLDVA